MTIEELLDVAYDDDAAACEMEERLPEILTKAAAFFHSDEDIIPETAMCIGYYAVRSEINEYKINEDIVKEILTYMSILARCLLTDVDGPLTPKTRKRLERIKDTSPG